MIYRFLKSIVKSIGKRPVVAEGNAYKNNGGMAVGFLIFTQKQDMRVGEWLTGLFLGAWLHLG